MMNRAVEMEECITVRVLVAPVWRVSALRSALTRAPGQLARRMLLDGLRASGFELAQDDDSSVGAHDSGQHCARNQEKRPCRIGC